MKESLEDKLKLGEQYYEEGKFNLAWEQFSSIIRDKKSTEYTNLLIKALDYCALILWEKEKFQSASKLLGRGREISSDSKQKVDLMRDLMLCYLKLGQPTEGAKVYEELEEIYKRVPELRGLEYPSVLYMAFEFYLNSLQQTMLNYEKLKQVYSILEKDFNNTDNFLQAAFLKSYWIDGNYAESIIWANRLLEHPVMEEEDNKFYKARWYDWLAYLHFNDRDDGKLALEYLKKSIEVDPNSSNDKNILLYLATLNYKQGNFEDAIEFGIKARDKFKIIKGELISYLYSLRVIAESYKRSGRRKQYRKIMLDIFRKSPFSLLSLPFIPDKMWINSVSFKRIISGYI